MPVESGVHNSANEMQLLFYKFREFKKITSVGSTENSVGMNNYLGSTVIADSSNDDAMTSQQAHLRTNLFCFVV